MTLEEQHAENQRILEMGEKQLRSNRKLLHWWNPFRFMLEDVNENLIREMARLREADAELMAMLP
jgi:hypothetical protein